MRLIKLFKHWHIKFPVSFYGGIALIVGIIIAVVGKIAYTNVPSIIIGASIVFVSLVTMYIFWIVGTVQITNCSPKKVTSLHNYYKNINWKNSTHDFSKVKMIVCDLDGTLLDHNGELSWVTVEMLRELYIARPDIIFVPATGRGYFSAKNALGDNIKGDYMICHNGAVLSQMRQYKPLSQKCIDTIFVQQLFDFTLNNDIHALVFSDSGESLIHNTCVSDNSWFEAWVKQYKLKHTPLNSKSLLYQCGIWVPNSKNKLFCKFVDENLSVEMYYYYHKDFTYYEITGIGVNKEGMISELCKRLNINHNEIVVFGNGNNDVNMISSNGLGVAVGNAEQILLKVADIIIEPNFKDGVAGFINEHFIEPVKNKKPNHNTTLDN